MTKPQVQHAAAGDAETVAYYALPPDPADAVEWLVDWGDALLRGSPYASRGWTDFRRGQLQARLASCGDERDRAQASQCAASVVAHCYRAMPGRLVLSEAEERLAVHHQAALEFVFDGDLSTSPGLREAVLVRCDGAAAVAAAIAALKALATRPALALPLVLLHYTQLPPTAEQDAAGDWWRRLLEELSTVAPALIAVDLTPAAGTDTGGQLSTAAATELARGRPGLRVVVLAPATAAAELEPSRLSRAEMATNIYIYIYIYVYYICIYIYMYIPTHIH